MLAARSASPRNVRTTDSRTSGGAAPVGTATASSRSNTPVPSGSACTCANATVIPGQSQPST